MPELASICALWAHIERISTWSSGLQFSTTELFVLAALARGQTLAEAGKELYIGHTGVSKALKAVERKADLQIVERHGRRLQLTARGSELAEAAQATLAHVEDFTKLVEAIRAGETGTIRIVANTTPGSYVLPSVLATFLGLFPKCRAFLHVTSGDIWKQFVDDAYDLGVGHPAVPPGLPCELLYDEELTLFVAPSSPLANVALGWHDLVGQTLIGPFTEPNWTEPWQELTRHGCRLDRRIEVHSHEAVKQLVEAGAGVGLLFKSAVTRELREGRLSELTTLNLSPKLPYWLVRRPGMRSGHLVGQFIELLRQGVSAGQSE